MPWPKNRRNSIPCTVRTSDKGRVIKELIFFNNWDLEPLDLLNGLSVGCYPPSPEVLIVSILLKLKVIELHLRGSEANL